MGTNRSEKPREVRYLEVLSAALTEGDDALLEFSVNCPRRGRIGVETCMECSHGGRLHYHGRSGPLVLERMLERDPDAHAAK